MTKERFQVRNNRNAEALDATLRMLKPGDHSLLKNDDGSFFEQDGCFVVESDNASFLRFAGTRQGYFELPST